jgi:RNA polymerase sigma-70 factor (ECF subfamily)
MRGDVEQALQLIRCGSPAALGKALGLLQDTVFSFSMKACGHWQDAEDTASLDELMPDNRKLQELLKSRTLSTENVAQSREAEGRLRLAVLALPPQCRIVLVLHDMKDLSTSEVAQY